MPSQSLPAYIFKALNHKARVSTGGSELLTLFSKFILSAFLLFSASVFASTYTSVGKTKNFADIYGRTAAENEILLYTQFLTPSEFTVGHEFYKMVEDQLNGAAYEKAFIGRGTYQTLVPFDQMTASFFQNIANIQYLLGSDYTIQAIDESSDNFTFQSTRALPIVSDLVTTVRMQVLEFSEINNETLTNIQNLTGRTENPERIVVQDMSGFNKNVLFARMITALYPSQNQSTHVEVLSASIFNDFPTFGSSFIESSSEKDLLGYADRLSLLNRFMLFFTSKSQCEPNHCYSMMNCNGLRWYSAFKSSCDPAEYESYCNDWGQCESL